MLKRTLLFTALSISGLADAQIPGAPTTVKSPNAASLGVYGEVPVSLYTGLPNIDVPLHTVHQGNVSVPISISYHASGFRPDDHPGWVGMGWNLNAGGAISRTINDLPDEYNNAGNTANSPMGGANAGFYYFSDIVKDASWNTTNYMLSLTNSFDVAKDTQPDEFSFNFSGYSGKFYKDTDDNGTWKVKCNRAVKVTLNAVNPFLPIRFPFLSTPPTNPVLPPRDAPVYDRGYSPSFGGFTLTTEDGTQYIFGGTDEAIEYSVGMSSQNTDEWTADTWYLTKIIAPNGRAVDFAYSHDDYISQMYIAVSEVLDYKTRDNSTGSTFTPCSGTGMSNSVSYFFTGKLIRPVYLVSIQDASGTVWFDRSDTNELRYPLAAYDDHLLGHGFGNRLLPFLQNRQYSLTLSQCTDKLIWKKLDQIRIVGNDGRLIRRVNMTYISSVSQRLTLDKLTESDGANNAKPPYQFSYNPPGHEQNQPAYLANTSDHWGFFNATPAPIASVSDLSAYYTNRNPSSDPEIYLAMMLNKITYPTGGVTEFTYKQHSCSKQVAEDRSQPLVSFANNQRVGGVCIAKISSYSLDNASQKNEKEYFYVTGYNSTATPNNLSSSGVVAGSIRYYFNDYRATDFFHANTTYELSKFSSQSVLSASSNGQGGHIGYSQVVEKRSDGSYFQYFYTNFDNGHGDEAALNTLQLTRTAYEPFSLRDQERGQLLQEKAYTSSGNLVSERNIQYARQVPVAPATDYVKSLKADLLSVCPNTNYFIDQATAYKIYTYSYLPVQESETRYDTNGSNGFTTTKTTAYNAYNLPTSVTTTTSNGNSAQTSYRYVTDLTYTGPNPYVSTTQGILMSVSRNIIAMPIETVRYRNGSVVGGTVVLPAWTNSTFVAPYQIYELDATQPIAANQYTSLFFPSRSDNYIPPVLDPKYKLRQTLDTYDAKGNVLSEVEEGNQNSCYLWDYNKTLLVAKVDNAIPSQVAFTGFEADGPRFVDNRFESAGPYAWDHDPRLGQTVHMQRTGGMTGNGFYRLDGQWGVGRGQLPAGNYEVTFWAKGGLANVYVFATQELSRSEGPSNAQGYRLVRFRVRVANGSINIDAYGRQVDIDDIRLYPVGAQMTTYTHSPLVGVSSISDANCRPTFYEYDGLQRLQIVRNAEGNIVKHLEYNYQH